MRPSNCIDFYSFCFVVIHVLSHIVKNIKSFFSIAHDDIITTFFDISYIHISNSYIIYIRSFSKMLPWSLIFIILNCVGSYTQRFPSFDVPQALISANFSLRFSSEITDSVLSKYKTWLKSLLKETTFNGLVTSRLLTCPLRLLYITILFFQFRCVIDNLSPSSTRYKRPKLSTSTIVGLTFNWKTSLGATAATSFLVVQDDVNMIDNNKMPKWFKSFIFKFWLNIIFEKISLILYQIP